MKSKSITPYLTTILAITSLLMVLQVATPVTVFASPTTWYVSPNSPTGHSGGSCAHPGFNTISAAITLASPGDTINVCTGTYYEQVIISESLTLRGVPYPLSTSPAPIIQAPATMTPDTVYSAYFDIVEITGPITASFSGFTVIGPVSTAQVGCSIGNSGIGIFVQTGAIATITDNVVAHIREQPAVQCDPYGVGILVGGAPTTGTATISGNKIFDYQQGGIVVDNTGSTATITGNTITGWTLAFQTANSIRIWQNGIKISNGALATVESNTVSSNLCPLGGTCGSDLLVDHQATGIYLDKSRSSTVVKNNAVSGNDVGIYVYDQGSPPTTVKLNTLSNNRYAGIAFFDGTYTASSNVIVGPGVVGIAAVADAANTVVTLSGDTYSGALTYHIEAIAGPGYTAAVT